MLIYCLARQNSWCDLEQLILSIDQFTWPGGAFAFAVPHQNPLAFPWSFSSWSFDQFETVLLWFDCNNVWTPKSRTFPVYPVAALPFFGPQNAQTQSNAFSLHWLKDHIAPVAVSVVLSTSSLVLHIENPTPYHPHIERLSYLLLFPFFAVVSSCLIHNVDIYLPAMAKWLTLGGILVSLSPGGHVRPCAQRLSTVWWDWWSADLRFGVR